MLSSTRIPFDDPEFSERHPDAGPPKSLLTHWRLAVAQSPDSPAALDADGVTLTYAEVDRLSDAVAVAILDAVGDDDRPIAAVLAHDSRAVVALMALLKTGRIRVVLDTHLPEQRLAQIVELSTAALALVDDRHRGLAETLRGPGGLRTLLSLDELLDAASARTGDVDDVPDARLATGAAREGKDPFEIVFTSGSTGVPKGVVQRHGAFVNDIDGVLGLRKIGPGDSSAIVLPLSFVAGSANLLLTLIAGARAVLVDPRDAGLAPLVALMRAGEITTLAGTPHLVRGIVAALGEGEMLDGVSIISTLGEAVHGRDVREILAHLPAHARFMNEVGSSETNGIAVHVVEQGDEVRDGALPAGRPFRGRAVRIVDADGRDVAPGEAGEVLVVSHYLSGGYWHAPELNAEKFGVDGDGVPFVRQGDLGRVGADGVLHLLGRGDAGVKIRGYLVEPSEVEGALLAMDDITEAVVIPQISQATPPAPTRLAAYVVPSKSGRTPSSAAIRRALRAVLPEYMVPSEIVQLPALPRTERGKIDRRALPPVPERRPDVDAMDQRELAMSTIWQQVLELPELAPDDDFMALGGDSLSAEELLSLVKEHFGVDVPSAAILQHPTLREFTARVVAEAAPEPANPDVVSFHPDAAGTPFFGFAGAGALALTFLPLAKRFPDSPFHAFQQHGIERRAVPDRSVEAMAARHARSIVDLHPSGPYRLIGHSFGGVVALEVARQLTEAGREVESVTILDTYLPRNVETADSEESPAADESLAVSGGQEPTLATGPIRALAGVKALPSVLLHRLVPDGLPPRDEYGRQIRAHLAGYLVHRGQRQYDSFFDRSVLLMRKHVVRPCPGRAALVLADENPDGPLAWDGVLTGDRRDIVIEAEHTSILREPFVAQLADELRAFVDAAPVSA
ncbi:AMP-binding protein [Frondihabitans australicus]|uniref:Acyl-CoA synthetase (AMP-forming)/AMP-acid ligase II n=1 Tax=Frondihabitans australicus TaxID=386892 RepID=A0A495IK92_9MICO|nr:AMP-binding protein [Frondihabitans australicus]RKR76387.1 acyl-CoA synthetase (AMP-forming)/AMP-acid ligase II [Frondihabitans australicus]